VNVCVWVTGVWVCMECEVYVLCVWGVCVSVCVLCF